MLRSILYSIRHCFLSENNLCFLGEPVNLREQQDAVEFFMSLVESLDEALKTLGHEQIMSKILGGSYSDQKICKGCPHRYSKEEPFSVISVDIRNHSTLQDSMEQYVKGKGNRIKPVYLSLIFISRRIVRRC